MLMTAVSVNCSSCVCEGTVAASGAGSFQWAATDLSTHAWCSMGWDHVLKVSQPVTQNQGISTNISRLSFLGDESLDSLEVRSVKTRRPAESRAAQAQWLRSRRGYRWTRRTPVGDVWGNFNQHGLLVMQASPKGRPR